MTHPFEYFPCINYCFVALKISNVFRFFGYYQVIEKIPNRKLLQLKVYATAEQKCVILFLDETIMKYPN